MSPRKQAGFDAAAQIECLVGMLRREQKHGNRDGLDTALQGVLPRMNDLASVLLSILGGDDERPTSELKQVVHGDAGEDEPVAEGEQPAPEPDDAGQPHVAPEMAAFCHAMVRDHLEQLHAVVLQLESILGEACNDRKGELPDGAPLTAWRLTQVLEEQLGSNQVLDGLQSALKLTTEEIKHARG